MDVSRVTVIAPNFKRRLSGVTSTIVQLVPLLSRTVGIATLGPGLPKAMPRVRWGQMWRLFRRPAERPFRIWHARRNPEMLGGLALKLLGAPIKLVFTSASQRDHTRWTKMLIRRMDAVVATSRKTANYLDVPNLVIMHGIDTRRFAPPADREAAVAAVGLDPGQHYAGCFGRIRHQKGTDLFVDAMIALLPGHPGWSAIVAGRATAEHRGFDAELRKRVAAAGLSERIHFVGEHSDIAPWYRALSLFVAPQRWEGFGLTPLEAMASGLAVVASDVGAFSEIVVSGRTGIVVPPGDAEAMTRAIGPFLEDGPRRCECGRTALEHVRRNFPLEREAADLIAVYEALWTDAEPHPGRKR